MVACVSGTGNTLTTAPDCANVKIAKFINPGSFTVSTAAATSQDEAETPKTGMAGLLARRSAPASRSESNVFLSRLLDNIYGTDRSKMLG